MRNLGIVAVVALTITLPAAAASRYDGSNRFVSPRIDGDPVVIQNASSGEVWSAWAYAQGGEFDIALSSRDAAGRWSSPVFIGRGDRADQIEPALAADGAGVIYLAYSDRGTGRIRIAVLAPTAGAWRPFAEIPATEGTAAAPAIRVVGNRLVVAFRAARSVEIVDVPLFGAISTDGIDDGPDPFGGANRDESGDGDGSGVPQGRTGRF